MKKETFRFVIYICQIKLIWGWVQILTFLLSNLNFCQFFFANQDYPKVEIHIMNNINTGLDLS